MPPSAGSVRMTPSSRRICTSASRPVSPIVRSAVAAAAGRASAPAAAPSACTTITDSECAMTSWSSRAMRARSIAAPTAAC